MFTLIWSCKEETVEVITTSSDAFAFNLLSSSEVLTISATTNWHATSSEKWCTMSDSVGTTKKVILVNCLSNLTGLPREAIITVHANKQTKTVLVSQRGGEILFAEDFNDNSNSWTQPFDSIINTINNGCFNLNNWGKRYYYTVGNKLLITDYSSDYLILANYQTVTGTNPFGLGFGYKDINNNYRVFIYPTGYFMVYQIIGGVSKLIKSQTISCVQTQNTLAVIKKGNFGYLYLNDTKICIFDFTPFGPYVGFYSFPQTEVAVNRLMINKL